MLPHLCEATERLFQPLEFHDSDHMHIELTKEKFHAKIYGQLGDKIGYPSSQAAFHFPNRIPERKQGSDYGEWFFATTDFTALLIRELWDSNRVTFSKSARVVYDYLLIRFAAQVEASKLRAEFQVGDRDRALSLVTELPYIDNAQLPLAPYQMIGLDGCINQECSALFMEQGTGKTPVVISRICNEVKDKMYKAIIVAPKNVRANWRNEFLRFSTVQGRVTVLRGTAINRVKLLIEALKEDDLKCKWSAVLVSYEALTMSWPAMQMVEWDLGVLDESHFIKSPRTKRYRTAMCLRERCRQRMCLTGTPITNQVLDVFPQLEFLGEGMSGFINWKRFQSYYGNYVKRGDQTIFTGYKNLPVLQERLNRVAYLVKKSEALPDLPEKTYDIVEVSMTPEQEGVYAQLRDKLYVECQDAINEAEKKDLVVKNVLTKLLRLAQITSGFKVFSAIYDDDGVELQAKSIDRFDPNPKIEMLVELLREAKKTIVWSCWVQDIQTITARLSIEGIDCVTFYGGTPDKDRDKAVDRFNQDPKCKVFVGNPAAGGTGLNLLGYPYDGEPTDTNCDHVIYFAQNWSMVARSQSEDRCHRLGTRTSVRYTDLCVLGTIDEEIRMRVVDKRLMAYTIQDVSDIMKRLLNGD